LFPQLKRHFFGGEILRLMAIVLLVKPLGLLTQMVLASSFGAGADYDAYALALFLVGYISSVGGQVFSAVVLPYTVRLKAGLPDAGVFGFLNAVFLAFLVPAAVAALVLTVGADLVVGLAGPGLPEETRRLAVRLVRLLAVPGALMVYVSMAQSVLNANSRFRLATALPAVNSLVMLVCVLLLHERMGIWSAALGFGISVAARFLLAAGAAVARRCVGPARPRLPAGTARRLWALGWMTLAIQAILALYAFIDKAFAASLAAGSISSLSYAMAFIGFGTQLFSLTLVTVMFTRMSHLIAVGEASVCNRYLQDNLRRVSRLVVPASIMVLAASPEIVGVLFERGEFTSSDTLRTAEVLAMYALGLPCFVVNGVITRVFYSLQRMREKVWLAAMYLGTNVLGNFLLMGPLGVKGLALSSSISINLHVATSLWVLHRYRAGISGGGVAATLGRNYLIGLAAWLAYRFAGPAGLLDGLDLAPDPAGSVLTAICRAAVIAVLFAGFSLAARSTSRFGSRAG